MAFIPNSEIQDNEYLYRAIPTIPNFWKKDLNKPSSALFKDKKGVSVDRDGERDESEILLALERKKPGYGICKLNAGQTKNIGTYVQPDPLPYNDYHALIKGSIDEISIPGSKAKKLCEILEVIKEPAL